MFKFLINCICRKDHVSAITATEQGLAILHLVGGGIITTDIHIEEAVKAFEGVVDDVSKTVAEVSAATSTETPHS